MSRHVVRCCLFKDQSHEANLQSQLHIKIHLLKGHIAIKQSR